MISRNRLLPIILILGLSAPMFAAGVPVALTQEDCVLVFPGANSCEKTRAIASGIVYSESWSKGSWETTEEFLGYVFLKSVAHEGKTLSILVGMTKAGVISKVATKGVDGVEERFLAQFHGMTAQDSFETAHTPEDRLFIPAKIRVLRENVLLSEKIAQGVREITLSAPKAIMGEPHSRADHLPAKSPMPPQN